MEPIEKTLTIKFCAPLRGVSEEFNSIYTGGIGKDATFEKQSKGWFLHFEGSHEAIFSGFEKPKVKVGSIASITIEIPKE